MSNSKIINDRYMFSDKNVVIDFANMISCENHIIANSSLSWWAAWLSDGDATAPKNWFTEVYSRAIGFKEEDIIPNKWKVF